MRKKDVLLIILVALILVMRTGTGNALTASIYERGCIVPYAMHNGSGVDTVVGISVATPIANQAIYWSFYDSNGVPLISGSIPILTSHYRYSFSLSNGTGGTHSAVVGWLLFTWDDDGVLSPADSETNIAANAFLINLAGTDAAFLPVVPLNIMDYNLAAPITLLNPPNSPLVSMAYGQIAAPALESGFLVSLTGDPRTTLVVFTPLDAPAQLTASAASTSGVIQEGIKIDTTSHKLNVFDVESIVPPGFTEGTLTIHTPFDAPIGIQFSLTFWSVVGAEQTIIATQH